MVNKIVDLTRLCTAKQIQYFLLECEEYKHNLILQDSYCRDWLIEYVLSNIEHRYMAIEELTEIPANASDVLPKCPLDEQMVIEQLLKEGMSAIVYSLLEQTEQRMYSDKRRSKDE